MYKDLSYIEIRSQTILYWKFMQIEKEDILVIYAELQKVLYGTQQADWVYSGGSCPNSSRTDDDLKQVPMIVDAYGKLVHKGLEVPHHMSR